MPAPRTTQRTPVAAALATAVLTTALATACLDDPARPTVADSEQALIGGEVDYGDEAVVFINTAGILCTGTLISPSVVATAAHCVDQVSSDPNATVYFGSDGFGDGLRVGVTKTWVHPNWTGSAGSFDVGVLLMLTSQNPDLAIPLNTSPLTEHIGEPIRRVGFGIHESGSDEVDGLKRQGTTVLHTVPAGTDYFFAGDDDLVTCNGDSGGPAFLTIDGVEYLAGIHSFGFGCIPPDNGDTRVDLYWESFLLPWVQANDPTCGEDGVCARIGCTDDPDCEPCGPDGTCEADCSLPDPDCATSELGEICQANTQCVSGLCVSWSADRQSKFCTRECDPADDDCPSGMSCQNVSSYGNICYYDDDPPGVLGDDCEVATDCGSYICEQGACVTQCDVGASIFCPDGFECTSADSTSYYCHALETGGGGGCSATGTHESPELPALLALALALAIAGRRSSGSSRARRPGSSRRRCRPSPGS